MSWNYRVVKEILKNGECCYAVHEVHYDERGDPAMMTVRDVSPGGEHMEEFLHSLTSWLTAIEKQVLVFDDKQNRFVSEEPPIESPLCPDCGRPMTRREPWGCKNCGEEMEV